MHFIIEINYNNAFNIIINYYSILEQNNLRKSQMKLTFRAEK